MPLATSQTSRAAMVSLFPEPAPAITAIGPGVAAITAACSAVGSVTPSSRASCGGPVPVRGHGVTWPPRSCTGQQAATGQTRQPGLTVAP